jgi:hypothetical protein
LFAPRFPGYRPGPTERSDRYAHQRKHAPDRVRRNLTFAIHAQTRGFSLPTVGIILMLLGAAAAGLTLIIWSQRARTVIRRSPSGEIIEERPTTAYDESPRL